jgi:hypothetical protein
VHLKCILFFIKTEFPYQGCYDCACNGGDEKEPELGEGFAAAEKGRAEAACRIDGSSGYRDGHEVDQHQGDADGESGHGAVPEF